MSTIDLQQRWSASLMNNYGVPRVALVRGDGAVLTDADGKRYLDGLGGIAVNTLGHNHPKLVPALQDQIGKIIHSSNYYHVPNAEVLAKKLTELANMTNVFFCCTGLEANEAALKLARKFHTANGQPERIDVIGFDGSFHGRTYAAVNAAGNPSYVEGFGPRLPQMAQDALLSHANTLPPPRRCSCGRSPPCCSCTMRLSAMTLRALPR